MYSFLVLIYYMRLLLDGLIEGRVWLQPYFHLRSDHALYLESATLYLCADPVNSTTCQIWTIAVSTGCDYTSEYTYIHTSIHEYMYVKVTPI